MRDFLQVKQPLNAENKLPTCMYVCMYVCMGYFICARINSYDLGSQNASNS